MSGRKNLWFPANFIGLIGLIGLIGQNAENKLRDEMQGSSWCVGMVRTAEGISEISSRFCGSVRLRRC